jgi:hypothetical protein
MNSSYLKLRFLKHRDAFCSDWGLPYSTSNNELYRKFLHMARLNAKVGDACILAELKNQGLVNSFGEILDTHSL